MKTSAPMTRCLVAAGMLAFSLFGASLAQREVAKMPGGPMTRDEVDSLLQQTRRYSRRHEDVLMMSAFAPRIAAAWARTGDLRLARKFAESLEMERDRCCALSEIALVRMRAGDAAGASEDFARAKKIAGRIPTALSDIVEYQARAGDIKGAIETARGIGDAQFLSFALGAIAEAQARAGDLTAALDTARSVPRQNQMGYPLGLIVSASAERGDFAGARRSIDVMTTPYQRSFALGTLAAAQVRAGDRSGASTTLESALRAAELVPDLDSRLQAFVGLAEARLKAGDSRGCLKALAVAVNLTSNLPDKGDPLRRDLVLCRIVEIQARSGDHRGSHERVREIRDESSRWEALSRLAAEEGRAGDVAGARRTADEIALAPARSRAYAGIARARAEAGDLPGAFAIASSLKSEESKAGALAAIAAAQADGGKFADAEQTVQMISDRGQKRSKDLALTDIAKAHCASGDCGNGWRTAKTIEDQELRFFAYGQVLDCLAR